VCGRVLLVNRREPVETGLALDAPVGTHPDHAEKVFLKRAAAVGTKNLGAAAVWTRPLDVQLHSQNFFLPSWSRGGWTKAIQTFKFWIPKPSIAIQFFLHAMAGNAVLRERPLDIPTS
jgi:hypothetical protein